MSPGTTNGVGEHVLTVDLGTSSLKATVWDGDGSARAQADIATPVEPGPGGAVEQDAGVWWTAMQRAAAELRERSGLARWKAISAIALTGARESVVPVTRAGVPLRRAVLWMDRRASHEAIAIAEWAGGPTALHRRTGLIPDPSFTAPTLLWFSRHDPDALEADLFLQPRDFVYLLLTGEAFTDPSMASRTMLLAIGEDRWDEELCEACGVRPGQLPAIVASASAPAGLRPEAALALGFEAGVPCVVGAGDRPAEALGAGVADGRAMESSGTTTNVSIIADAVPPDPKGLVLSRACGGAILIEQGLSGSGSVLDWARRLTGVSDRSLDDLLGDSAPGSNDLCAMPFVFGSRAPRWRADATGSLIGLAPDHQAADVVRAFAEGISFEIAGCVERLAASGVGPEEIALVGGGNRSAHFAQLKADALGRELVRLAQPHTASLGAFLLATAAVGGERNPAERARTLNPVERRFTPDPGSASRYREIRRRYETVLEALASPEDPALLTTTTEGTTG